MAEPRTATVAGKELTVEETPKGLLVKGTLIPELAARALTEEETLYLRVGRAGWFRGSPSEVLFHTVANAKGAFKGVTFVAKD